MKRYDSIEKYNEKFLGKEIIAFDKLDGSNLRFEYNRKRKFYKFGTRNEMIDKNSQFGFAVDLFINKYLNQLDEIFNSKKYSKVQSFVCYAELIGTKSEFGYHDFKNDIFDIVLFDINQYKKGIIDPYSFIEDFGHLHIPNIIYEGKLNDKFVLDIRNNIYNLSEGVICKGIDKNKTKSTIFNFKLKSYDWLNRLKSKNEKLYNIELKESF